VARDHGTGMPRLELTESQWVKPWRTDLVSILADQPQCRPVLQLCRDGEPWSAGAILALGDRMAGQIGGRSSPSRIWVCDDVGCITLAALVALRGTVVVVDGRTPALEAGNLAEAAPPDLLVTFEAPCSLVDWAERSQLPILLVSSGLDVLARNLPRCWPARSDPVADLGVVTSGTSSASRVIELSSQQITAALSGVYRFGDLRAEDLVLNVSPLHHTLGLVTGLIAPVLRGARVARAALADFAAAKAASERPTWCAASPAAFELLLSIQPFGDRWAPRVIRLSSAPVPVSVADRLFRVADSTILNAYAMSEAPGEISSRRLLRTNLGNVGSGTVCEVGVFDEVGLPVPSGCDGEIWIRGPNVALDALLRGRSRGRSRSDDLTRQGWAPTGDRGAIELGELVIKGRIDDLINCGGEKVAPEGIETVLAEHPDVKECVAFPVPHRTLGQGVAVAVVANGPGIRVQDLRRFILGRLPPTNNPLRILIVSAIPRARSGKISRRSLADRFGLGGERDPSAWPEGPTTGGGLAS